ncbi:MAG: DnaJ C-terminal domain-containing protein, partial [Burkholderiaceae bacterium]
FIDEQGRPGMREQTLDVRIPKGLRQGQQIRLAGQGGPGLGSGEAGDLYLEIEFEPHRLYHVEGRDVFLDVPIAPWEAALGATIEVPTPDAGKVELQVPAGSSGGRKLRLKGKGIPGKVAGDLYVVLKIAVPPADTEAARQAWQALQKAQSFNPRAHFGS